MRVVRAGTVHARWTRKLADDAKQPRRNQNTWGDDRDDVFGFRYGVEPPHADRRTQQAGGDNKGLGLANSAAPSHPINSDKVAPVEEVCRKRQQARN